MVNHDCSRYCFRHRSFRQGAAAVELALVLPLLLAIAMMTIDFGSTVSTYLVLSNAARTGADYAATHRVTSMSRPAWESHIHSAIAGELTNFRRFKARDLKVATLTQANIDGTTQVTVDVRYSHETLVPWPGFPSRIPLHYRLEMRQYQ